MRLRALPLALFLCAAAPLAAQDPSSTAVILDPQFVSYQLGTGSTARTISQLGVPFAVIVPFSDRFNLDISSSYANSQVKVPGAATSSITGLTDAQVRGNLMLGDNAAVSLDSRRYGPVPLDALVGRAWFRYGPVSRIGRIRRSAAGRP